MLQNVLLRDPSADSGPLEARDVHAVLASDSPHEWRRLLPAKLVPVPGRCRRGRTWDCLRRRHGGDGGAGLGLRGLLPGLLNDADDGVDGYRLTFPRGDLGEDSLDWRRNLSLDLVGCDLEERFVPIDMIADFLEPAHDRAFDDRFAHLGHDDLSGHDYTGPQRH